MLLNPALPEASRAVEHGHAERSPPSIPAGRLTLRWAGKPNSHFAHKQTRPALDTAGGLGQARFALHLSLSRGGQGTVPAAWGKASWASSCSVLSTAPAG
ncbi:POC1 centriolar protein-like protein A [Platysternon megacephalum]|uniref:POC1 centriolar protein-like protein A n=1 Tax=Platysternon megacephalum TaxID=55544 RepID=A0A4D9DX04_9SAUR|nr:POC1 centriolar protein-like protein A [Platysternon megacephalum]